MTRRIYEVRVTKTLYVVADDESEACSIAEHYASDEMSAADVESRVPERWQLSGIADSLPWTAEGMPERTLREWWIELEGEW